MKYNVFWILNLIEAYPCGAKYENEICYRILHYRGMGLESPENDGDMKTHQDGERSWYCRINSQTSKALRIAPQVVQSFFPAVFAVQEFFLNCLTPSKKTFHPLVPVIQQE